MSNTKTNLQTGQASGLRKAQFCQYLFPSSNEGLTLIELLVVLIITGILAAISFPAFTNQIGKSRETEATNQLGTISRAQQAYHFERQTFASTLDLLTLNSSFNAQYYNYPDPVLIADGVKHRAEPIQPIENRMRNYASGIYFDAGTYEIIICQGRDIGENVDAPDASGDPCTNGGNQLE